MYRLILSFLMIFPVWAVQARVLEVGPGRPLTRPSAALAEARAGDVIRIDQGQYEDCLVVTLDRITLEGAGPETVLANRTCRGRGILLIYARDVTIRGLTLRGARVADRNGAGILAEGGNLTVERAHFVDNENGILGGGNITAAVRIVASTFIANGKCEPVCAHGVYIGQAALLRIERSTFRDTRVGHHIKSRAGRTEIVENDIADGTTGNSSYLIDIPNGGDVLIERNRLRKGPLTSNPGTAIMLGAEGETQPTRFIRILDNEFHNEMTEVTAFVRNLTRAPAVLERNRLSGPSLALEGPGSVK